MLDDGSIDSDSGGGGEGSDRDSGGNALSILLGIFIPMTAIASAVGYMKWRGLMKAPKIHTTPSRNSSNLSDYAQAYPSTSAVGLSTPPWLKTPHHKPQNVPSPSPSLTTNGSKNHQSLNEKRGSIRTPTADNPFPNLSAAFPEYFADTRGSASGSRNTYGYS